MKEDKPKIPVGRSKICEDGEKPVSRTVDGAKKRVCADKTTLRTKCEKRAMKYKGKCKKTEDKPKGTGKAGRPKKQQSTLSKKE